MAKRARHEGLLPGEYRRRSLVAVERVMVEPVATTGERGLQATDIYVVQTRRMDNLWTHWAQMPAGTEPSQLVRLPGKVVDAMLRHRESINKEHRRRTAQETHRRLSALAQKDQQEAQRA